MVAARRAAHRASAAWALANDDLHRGAAPARASQPVAQILVPTLQEGDIVIMDNLGSHKGNTIHTAIRTAGEGLLFLPAYSPDFNPTEQAFVN
jgi:transposase